MRQLNSKQQCDVQIAKGISAFKAEVPRILMVSSAAVERNAIIGDDGGWCTPHTTSHFTLPCQTCAVSTQSSRVVHVLAAWPQIS